RTPCTCSDIRTNRPHLFYSFFSSNTTAPTQIYTLSLHDALPISQLRHPQEPARVRRRDEPAAQDGVRAQAADPRGAIRPRAVRRDRKSTRLNSSHVAISYAVFCLKKKKKKNKTQLPKNHENNNVP